MRNPSRTLESWLHSEQRIQGENQIEECQIFNHLSRKSIGRMPLHQAEAQSFFSHVLDIFAERHPQLCRNGPDLVEIVAINQPHT